VPENPSPNTHAPFASSDESAWFDRQARHLFEAFDIRRLEYEATLTPAVSDGVRLLARQRFAASQNALMRLIAIGLLHDPDVF